MSAKRHEKLWSPLTTRRIVPRQHVGELVEALPLRHRRRGAGARHVRRRLDRRHAVDVARAVGEDALGAHAHDELRADELAQQRVIVGDARAAVHAQAKPPVYTVAEIDVGNNDAYMKEYAPKAQALIKQKGGKLLAASNGTVFEGAPAKRVAIQQWESMEKAKAWHSSKEYKENRKVGDKYAKFRIVAVEGRP